MTTQHPSQGARIPRTHGPHPRAGERRGRSLLRRAAVTLAFLVAMAGTSIGVGAFGGDPIAEAAGGLLAADSTHLAPASPAFSIWTVIYIGLGAYTLWQWWDPRDERGIALPAIASLLLNAAWILVIQAGWVWLSVPVIALLLVVLGVLFHRTTRQLPRSLVECLVADGTFGLYLGWVSVATCANIAAALAGAGFNGFGVPSLLAVVVLVVVAAIGVALTARGRRPIAAPLAMIWGLVWIAVGRAGDAPYSPTVAIAAVVVAAVIAISAAVHWLRGRAGAAAQDHQGITGEPATRSDRSASPRGAAR